MAGSTNQLWKLVERIIGPPLADMGFVVDLRRKSFRRIIRKDELDFIQIVEFQTGRRSLAGRFTVNLGVFCQNLSHHRTSAQLPEVVDCLPEMCLRLGFLYHAPRTFVSKLLRRGRGPATDYWWQYSYEGDSTQPERSVRQVLAVLIDRGIPWLDEAATPARYSDALAALEERRAELARRGPPKMIGPLIRAGERITRAELRRRFMAALEQSSRRSLHE